MHRHGQTNYKFVNSGDLSWFPRPLRAFRSTRLLFTLAFAHPHDFVAPEGIIRGHEAVHDNRLMHTEVLRLARFANTTSPHFGVTSFTLTIRSY